jgi:hypothetical protein
LTNVQDIAAYGKTQRFRGGIATIQLGWGTNLAHCSRSTFESVRTAHLVHLLSLENIAELRNPLYHTNPTTGYPPRREGPETILTADQGVGGFFFQHFSTRRTLVIRDHIYEGILRYCPPPDFLLKPVELIRPQGAPPKSGQEPTASPTSREEGRRADGKG